MLVYNSRSKFCKFYSLDLFTNELVECSESDFDRMVIAFRDLYEMEYITPNCQVFKIDNVVHAKRER